MTEKLKAVNPGEREEPVGQEAQARKAQIKKESTMDPLLDRVGGMFFLGGFIYGCVNPGMITWQK